MYIHYNNIGVHFHPRSSSFESGSVLLLLISIAFPFEHNGPGIQASTQAEGRLHILLLNLKLATK